MTVSLRDIALLILAIAVALLPDPVHAERSRFRVDVSGFSEATVTRKNVTLADVATVMARDVKDDESAIALRNLVVAASPAPGEQRRISAAAILDQLKKQGVNLNQVAYTFPKEIAITRAGRRFDQGELEDLVREYLESRGDGVTLRELKVTKPVWATPEVGIVSVVGVDRKKPGFATIQLESRAPGESADRYAFEARVDDWREVPVAKRTLARGIRISADDVVMARLNMAQLPLDVSGSVDEVVGLQVDRDIPTGEALRRAQLVIPPAIEAGSKIVMRYRRGGFEATATGIALEPGLKGNEIRVRNDGSKKVVSGLVIEPGLVEVR